MFLYLFLFAVYSLFSAMFFCLIFYKKQKDFFTVAFFIFCLLIVVGSLVFILLFLFNGIGDFWEIRI